MVRSRTICAALAVVFVPRIVRAECPPTATVVGDAALVHDVTTLLRAHGVVDQEVAGCEPIHVSISHRDDKIVLAESTGEGLTHERVVSELDTAATVIESWTRTDLDASVFAFHPTLAVTAPTPAPTLLIRQESTSVVEQPRNNIQAFGAFEASFADDRTGWLGFVVGACVQIGTLCASARGRFSAVVEGPGWAERERHAEDLLFGGDIPRHFGKTILSFGFGAGMGATHTGVEDMQGVRGSETFGLRADAHVAWIVPLGHKLALDLSASIDLSQVTDVETSSSIPSLADEPRAIARLGAGLHVGGQ